MKNKIFLAEMHLHQGVKWPGVIDNHYRLRHSDFPFSCKTSLGMSSRKSKGCFRGKRGDSGRIQQLLRQAETKKTSVPTNRYAGAGYISRGAGFSASLA